MPLTADHERVRLYATRRGRFSTAAVAGSPLPKPAHYTDVLLKAGVEQRGLPGGPLRLEPEPLAAGGRQALEPCGAGVLEGVS